MPRRIQRTFLRSWQAAQYAWDFEGSLKDDFARTLSEVIEAARDAEFRIPHCVIKIIVAMEEVPPSQSAKRSPVYPVS